MADMPVIETPSGKVMHLQDWVSLRDYIDLRFEMNTRAIDKAEGVMNKRLEGMNEFRESLKDQASKFITRDEAKLMLDPLCLDIRMLRSIADKAEGKASQTSMLVTGLISIIGLVLGIIHIFAKLG